MNTHDFEVKWKKVRGYEGLYEVSDTGLVRSLARIDMRGHKVNPRILSACVNKQTKYLTIALQKDGKGYTTTIHKVVADNFLDMKGKHVDHINENRQDNRLCNLRAVTHAENMSFKAINKDKTGYVALWYQDRDKFNSIRHKVTKKCFKCKKDKKLEKYHKSDKKVLGVTTYCKKCDKNKIKRYAK